MLCGKIYYSSLLMLMFQYSYKLELGDGVYGIYYIFTQLSVYIYIYILVLQSRLISTGANYKRDQVVLVGTSHIVDSAAERKDKQCTGAPIMPSSRTYTGSHVALLCLYLEYTLHIF